MHRQFPILILLVVLLSACGSGQTSAAATTTPHPTVPPTPVSPCKTIKAEPTPGPEEPSLFPPVSKMDWIQGPPGATVTIIEYGDFQSPGSAGLAPVLAQLETEHPNDLRLVYRHFPLMSVHDKAALATQAAEAAGLQNKFWEMHDLLFAKQAEWQALSPEDFEGWLNLHASNLGLDGGQFKAKLKGEDIVARVQKTWDDGRNTGLPGTPFVLINGQIYSGPLDRDSLDYIIRLIVLGKRQFTSCPPMTVNPLKQYIATLHTGKGDIRIQLFADKAPITVNSFIFLARSGWFDNVTFHRVIPGFVAQTGDPSGTGQGNPGYFIKNEIDPALKYDKPGMAGMANSGADTNGSQFFITYGPAPHLNGNYTIFGQVISGMDVLEQITPRDPQAGISLPPGDTLISVTIEEK